MGICTSTIPVRCGSKTRRITPRRPAGRPTRISWWCRGKSRTCTSAATTTSCFPSRCTSRESARRGSRSPRQIPVYGKVYHLGSSEDLLQLLEAENGFWYTSHPRTKSSGGQPDVYWDKPFAKSDTFLGLDFTQAMGTDLSEKRMTEYRSFDASDTMNNLNANSGLRPKVSAAGHRHLRAGTGRQPVFRIPDRLPEARPGAGPG